MIKQFFFTACIIMLTGVFLLLWDSPPESFLRTDNAKVEKLPSADSYMKKINTVVFSAEGAKKYTLEATEMTFFSSRSELKLLSPKLMAHKISANGNQLSVNASSGILQKDTQVFKFSGDVNARWETLAGETMLKAGSLFYSIKEDSAKATGGVRLTSPNAEISGDSFSVNFQAEILKINSRVRAVHDAI